MEESYSQKIARRHWNLPDKGELECHREETFIDDIVQKNHLEREVLASLDGVESVFDGGAGCGRFSILLARMGRRVTHFDVSRPMLDKARQLAEQAGVSDRMTFVQGCLEDLSGYGDREFDLVISFDAPVSYTYPRQEQVIGELVRICRKRILLSVSSRLGMLPYLANPLQKLPFILDEHCADPWVKWYLSQRESMIEGFAFHRDEADRLLAEGLLGGQEEIAAYEQGGAPWCITYAFLPEELQGILSRNGVGKIRMAGPGAFARTIPRELLVKIMKDPDQKKEFLDFCYRYDSNPWVCGMGKDNLFAAGEILPSEESGDEL